jgi:hypothetical protein
MQIGRTGVVGIVDEKLVVASRITFDQQRLPTRCPERIDVRSVVEVIRAERGGNAAIKAVDGIGAANLEMLKFALQSEKRIHADH